MRKHTNQKTQLEPTPGVTDRSPNATDWGTHDPRIQLLIQKLSSPHAAERERARNALVMIGDEIVRPLIEVVETAGERARLEAARALAELADPAAIAILIQCLEDEHQDLRWVAAEGLLNIDGPAVEPLLLALIDRAWAHTILDGTAHVVRGLARRVSQQIFGPLISTMTHAPEPGVNVPPAAEAALDAWRKVWKSTPRTQRMPIVSDQPSGRPKPWYDRRV